MDGPVSSFETTISDPFDEAPIGFGGDAQVSTDEGSRSVGSLVPGTRIQTRDHGLQPLLSVIALPDAPIGSPNPVRLAEGVLGCRHRLHLGVGQPVLLRHWLTRALFGWDEALIRVGWLLNGDHVAAAAPVSLFLLRFASQQLISVSGVWLPTPGVDGFALPELVGDEARAAGESGIFVRRPGEQYARRGHSWQMDNHAGG